MSTKIPRDSTIGVCHYLYIKDYLLSQRKPDYMKESDQRNNSHQNCGQVLVKHFVIAYQLSVHLVISNQGDLHILICFLIIQMVSLYISHWCNHGNSVYRISRTHWVSTNTKSWREWSTIELTNRTSIVTYKYLVKDKNMKKLGVNDASWYKWWGHWHLALAGMETEGVSHTWYWLALTIVGH